MGIYAPPDRAKLKKPSSGEKRKGISRFQVREMIRPEKRATGTAARSGC